MLCLASISAMIVVVKGLNIGGDYCLEVSRTDPALGSLFEIVHKCRVRCETMPASAVGHAGRGVRGGVICRIRIFIRVPSGAFLSDCEGKGMGAIKACQYVILRTYVC